MTIYGVVTIAYNNAMELERYGGGDGGGINLQQSNLEIKGSCNISNNCAIRGGGIHATSSSIAIHQTGTLQLMDNSAVDGGAMYPKVNPKLYILHEFAREYIFLEFKGNDANYGGAVYVADDTNSGACSLNIECFIQILAVYQLLPNSSRTIEETVLFSVNDASNQGFNLFGGLLDRCVLSLIAKTRRETNSAITALKLSSNITSDSPMIFSFPI